MSAGSVTACTAPNQGAGPGSTPRAALQQLQVQPLSLLAARIVIERNHYLPNLPGGTHLTFGVFNGGSLAGAISLGPRFPT